MPQPQPGPQPSPASSFSVQGPAAGWSHAADTMLAQRHPVPCHWAFSALLCCASNEGWLCTLTLSTLSCAHFAHPTLILIDPCVHCTNSFFLFLPPTFTCSRMTRLTRSTGIITSVTGVSAPTAHGARAGSKEGNWIMGLTAAVLSGCGVWLEVGVAGGVAWKNLQYFSSGLLPSLSASCPQYREPHLPHRALLPCRPALDHGLKTSTK